MSQLHPTLEKGLLFKFMKFSSISFFIRVRENLRGYSSFSGGPFNFADFLVPGTLLNGENDIPTPTFLSSILTITGGSDLGLIWGSWAGFSGCKVEDEDAREEMMEKKTVGEGFAMEVSGEEDDLAAIDGLVVRMVATLGFGGVNGGFTVMVEDDGDLWLMVVEIGFGGDGKVGDSSDKVGGDGIRVSVCGRKN
ncbi:hypothetical protein V8G54_008360 [Vigna mungo]|uniref:Uncharacterized protein n=1 Tax=Vigna mungo TaxID=3915 RepID=A0AAQ3P720_VIGMU